MIRTAESDDFPALMSLYQQLHPDDPVLSNGNDRKAFNTILAAPDLHLFLLYKDQQALASTYLNIIPNITRAAAPYGIIENVVTDAQHRGLGIGQQIMAHTLQTAWQQGCYKVMLLTGSQQPSTHHFYRACGFDGSEKHGYIARPQ